MNTKENKIFATIKKTRRNEKEDLTTERQKHSQEITNMNKWQKINALR